MATRTTAVGTQSSGDHLTAAEYNDAAGGWIGYVQVTSDQTGITTVTDLTSLTVTVTVGTNRYIKITGQCRMENSSAVGGCQLLIREGTTTLNSGVQWSTDADTTSVVGVQVILASPSAGSHTYKLSADTVSAGTVAMRASATGPAFILVEDLGPA